MQKQVKPLTEYSFSILYNDQKTINEVKEKIKEFPPTEIPDSGFAKIVKLTQITIPNGVTRIGAMAFNNCTNLRSITILSSEINIGPMAFNNSDLKEIRISESLFNKIKGNINNFYSNLRLKSDVKILDLAGKKLIFEKPPIPIQSLRAGEPR